MKILNLIRRTKDRSYTKGYTHAAKHYAAELRKIEAAHRKALAATDKQFEKRLAHYDKLHMAIAKRERQREQYAQKQREKTDKLTFKLMTRSNQVEAHDREMKKAYDKAMDELSMLRHKAGEVENIRAGALKDIRNHNSR